MEKIIKTLSIGFATIFVGFFFSMFFAGFVDNSDIYIDAMAYIKGAILYLSGIIAMCCYLILKAKS